MKQALKGDERNMRKQDPHGLSAFAVWQRKCPVWSAEDTGVLVSCPGTEG